VWWLYGNTLTEDSECGGCTVTHSRKILSVVAVGQSSQIMKMNIGQKEGKAPVHAMNTYRGSRGAQSGNCAHHLENRNETRNERITQNT
jgi:hypothetical protein